jgi:hypothetical protein
VLLLQCGSSINENLELALVVSQRILVAAQVNVASVKVLGISTPLLDDHIRW